MTAKKKTTRRIELKAGEAVRLTREEARVSVAQAEYQAAMRTAQAVLTDILKPHLRNGETPVGWELVLDGDKAELVEVERDG